MGEPFELPIFEIGGVVKDGGQSLSLPNFKRLLNLYKPDGQHIYSRPHKSVAYNAVNIQGFMKDAENNFYWVADRKVYKNGTQIGTCNGSGDVRYTFQQNWIVFCCGSSAFRIRNDAVTDLVKQNVYDVTSGQGPNWERVLYASTNDLYYPFYSEWGLPEDVGEDIASAKYGNLVSEGGDLNKVDSPLLTTKGLFWFAGEWILFTRKYIYRVTLNSDEIGFDPILIKQFIFDDEDAEILDVRPAKIGAGIVFMTTKGVYIYTIGENGPTIQKMSQQGNQLQLIADVVEGEARFFVNGKRGIVILNPSLASEYVWVFNVNANDWTEWDLKITDMITVGKNTYARIQGYNDIFLLDESTNPDDESFEILFETGVTDFGDRTTKILREIQMNLSADSFFEVAMAAKANKKSGKNTTYTTYSGEYDVIRHRVSATGERMSFSVSIKNNGFMTFENGKEQNPVFTLDGTRYGSKVSHSED